MDVKDICPFVRQALFVKLSGLENELYREIKTVDCRLFYVLSGEGSIIVNGVSHKLYAGTCVIVKCGTGYTWQSDENDGLNMMVINFDFTRNGEHIKETFSPIPAEIFNEDDITDNVYFSDFQPFNSMLVVHYAGIIEERLHLITTEYQIGNQYCDQLLSSLMQSVIFSLLRQLDDQANETSTKQSILTRRIIRYVQKHYNEPLTNTDLERLFHFNPIYTNRVFKKHTGVTVQQFLTDYRLRMSTEFLKSSESSVGEIASMVGYGDLAYYSKLFKKMYGVTPTHYRKKG